MTFTASTTLTIRHNVRFWAGQGDDFVAVRDLFVRLVPAYRKMLGAEHPDTLGCNHNVARWIGYAGDPAGVRDLYIEHLAVRERVLGTEYSETHIRTSSCAAGDHRTIGENLVC